MSHCHKLSSQSKKLNPTEKLIEIKIEELIGNGPKDSTELYSCIEKLIIREAKLEDAYLVQKGYSAHKIQKVKHSKKDKYRQILKEVKSSLKHQFKRAYRKIYQNLMVRLVQDVQEIFNQKKAQNEEQQEDEGLQMRQLESLAKVVESIEHRSTVPAYSHLFLKTVKYMINYEKISSDSTKVIRAVKSLLIASISDYQAQKKQEVEQAECKLYLYRKIFGKVYSKVPGFQESKPKREKHKKKISLFRDGPVDIDPSYSEQSSALMTQKYPQINYTDSYSEYLLTKRQVDDHMKNAKEQLVMKQIDDTEAKCDFYCSRWDATQVIPSERTHIPYLQKVSYFTEVKQNQTEKKQNEVNNEKECKQEAILQEQHLNCRVKSKQDESEQSGTDDPKADKLSQLSHNQFIQPKFEADKNLLKRKLSLSECGESKPQELSTLSEPLFTAKKSRCSEAPQYTGQSESLTNYTKKKEKARINAAVKKQEIFPQQGGQKSGATRSFEDNLMPLIFQYRPYLPEINENIYRSVEDQAMESRLQKATADQLEGSTINIHEQALSLRLESLSWIKIEQDSKKQTKIEKQIGQLQNNSSEQGNLIVVEIDDGSKNSSISEKSIDFIRLKQFFRDFCMESDWSTELKKILAKSYLENFSIEETKRELLDFIFHTDLVPTFDPIKKFLSKYDLSYREYQNLFMQIFSCRYILHQLFKMVCSIFENLRNEILESGRYNNPHNMPLYTTYKTIKKIVGEQPQADMVGVENNCLSKCRVNESKGFNLRLTEESETWKLKDQRRYTFLLRPESLILNCYLLRYFIEGRTNQSGFVDKIGKCLQKLELQSCLFQ